MAKQAIWGGILALGLTIVNPVMQTMTASWYGEESGTLTASGSVFSPAGLTAAHKELAFGTFLKVYNPANMKSVIVEVTDRGPFIPGRDLDLSKGAADALDFTDQGVGDLWVIQVEID